MDLPPVKQTEPERKPPPLAPEEEPAPPEDRQLVQAARSGDMRAYDQLIERYQERIYATIYHMTSNHEDANDLAQDTFIRRTAR